MTDPASEPQCTVKGKPRRWAVYLVALSAIVAISVSILLNLPIYGRAAEKSIRVRNWGQASTVFYAIKMYAGDNDGQYPNTLAELDPDYIHPIPKYLPDWDGPASEWLYVPGLNTSSPTDWIVLASPTEAKRRFGPRERYVVYNDHSKGVQASQIIPAAQFDRQFAEQKKAMAAKAP